MTDLTVIIPTLNEDIHIGRAVKSALPLGDVLVVDSGSSDATVEIAADLGARVIAHPWEGYAAQKNWALDQLRGRSAWVLFLDADEWLSDALRSEITQAVLSDKAGFHIPRRIFFGGRLLKHATWYPDYQLRLFRSDAGRFEDRLVHEHALVRGEIGFLENAILHENLKGLDDFIQRHLRYADLEAREILGLTEQGRTSRRGRLMGPWPERRRYVKTHIWYRLPLRPVLRFLWLYVLKRGFLDGQRGLLYCQLIAAYEAMIDARLFELRSVNPGSSGPDDEISLAP